MSVGRRANLLLAAVWFRAQTTRGFGGFYTFSLRTRTTTPLLQFTSPIQPCPPSRNYPLPSERSGSSCVSPGRRQRGHGQISCQLSTRLASSLLGDRQFVQSAYPYLKKHNPELPVLIREAKGTPARAFARFGGLRRDVPTFASCSTSASLFHRIRSGEAGQLG